MKIDGACHCGYITYEGIKGVGSLFMSLRTTTGIQRRLKAELVLGVDHPIFIPKGRPAAHSTYVVQLSFCL
jgi:hypothetical protein